MLVFEIIGMIFIAISIWHLLLPDYLCWIEHSNRRAAIHLVAIISILYFLGAYDQLISQEVKNE